MKKMFKNIIKEKDESNKNIIKSIIEREAVKILRCYFYDIVKSNEYIYNELKNYKGKLLKNVKFYFIYLLFTNKNILSILCIS